MSLTPEECAREVLDVVPLIMRTIRGEMRSHRTADLSVPQFRALLFISRNPGTSLSEVADHLGLTPPSTSKLVDGLVLRRLVKRETASEDRRYITLGLTSQGEALLDISRQAAQSHLAEALAALPEPERSVVGYAMQVLRPLFTPGQFADTQMRRNHGNRGN